MLFLEIVRLNDLLNMQGIEPERAAFLLIRKMELIRDYKESWNRDLALSRHPALAPSNIKRVATDAGTERIMIDRFISIEFQTDSNPQEEIPEIEELNRNGQVNFIWRGGYWTGEIHVSFGDHFRGSIPNNFEEILENCPSVISYDALNHPSYAVFHAAGDVEWGLTPYDIFSTREEAEEFERKLEEEEEVES
jgi:hypothetical protein